VSRRRYRGRRFVLAGPAAGDEDLDAFLAQARKAAQERTAERRARGEPDPIEVFLEQLERDQEQAP
jgi:hypothetical protein